MVAVTLYPFENEKQRKKGRVPTTSFITPERSSAHPPLFDVNRLNIPNSHTRGLTGISPNSQQTLADRSTHNRAVKRQGHATKEASTLPTKMSPQFEVS